MTIDDFIRATRDDLQRFRDQWVSGDPTKYPDELDEGEWFEQFLAFQTSTDDGSANHG